MATVEEIEKYCRNCVSRDFVNGKGLVCKRTRELPDFDEECENFEKDKELLKMAPPKPDDFPVSMTEEELLAEENLPKGVLYASVACILGAVAWSLISVSTGLQMGYMAIGVGFLVGFAMRQGNLRVEPNAHRREFLKGIRPVFGLLGAALALISCVLGDFLSIIGFAAKDYDMTFFEVLAGVDYGEIFSVMVKNVVSMSALFYGIAVYEGYKLSFRAQKHPVGGKI